MIKVKTIIDKENLQKSAEMIQKFVSCKKLVLNGIISTEAPTNFPSRNQQKKFRALMERMITNPSMKSTNKFLNALSFYNNTVKASVDYSKKEANIISSRNEWKEALRIAKELKAKYKEEKGDFYKS